METKQSIEVTCPECCSPLSEVQLGSFVEYRCLVRHAYSAHTVARDAMKKLAQAFEDWVVLEAGESFKTE